MGMKFKNIMDEGNGINGGDRKFASASQLDIMAKQEALTIDNLLYEREQLAILPTIVRASSPSIAGATLHLPIVGEEVQSIYSYSVGKYVKGSEIAPDNQAVKADYIKGEITRPAMTVEFGFYGLEFEYRIYGAQSAYRILVDEGNGFKDASGQLGYAGGSMYEKVTFATAKNRIIRIEAGIFLWFGIYCLPTDKLFKSSTIELSPKAVIFGDSFVGSSSSVFAMESLSQVIIRSLNMNGINSSAGGTGYINDHTDGYKFIDRLEDDVYYYKPDFILTLGGYNDAASSIEDITSAVNEYYDRLLESYDRYQLIAICPLSPTTATATLTNIASAIEEVCKTKGIASINSISGETYSHNGTLLTKSDEWVTGTGNAGTPIGDGNADWVTSSDGTHPTVDGHRYEGVRLASECAKILRYLVTS